MRSDPQYLAHVWPSVSAVAVDGEHHVSQLHSAQERARKAWGDIHSNHGRRMADQTKTEAARVVESAKFARNILESQRNTYNEARENAENTLRVTQAQLLRKLNPPSDPGEAALFAEIRAHLRGMTLAERIKAVQEVVNTPGSDLRILHAAVAGPALVSLLPPDLASRYTDIYHASTSPNEFGRAVRLSTSLEEAATGFQRLEEHVAAMVDFQQAKAYEQAAA
ncbi:hypothetical protein [Dyella telluris]|uniref:Uncharacterized protein n=1 Tax=Dyella telluris TaxID=2763498 RepID=A0A7G8Q2H0_9GAMM|nr:hypothetical protein [Dyella telluris]QNK00978.1 hypothetical protein H8F01_18195 [Dyella telluris]